MSVPRFLHPNIIDQSIIDLEEHESHHASRVLRCRVGERVIVFDGMGYEAEGRIVGIDKRSVRVEIGTRLFAPRDHSNRLHIALALPKGERQRNAIEKMVELGVDSLTPIQTEYAIVAHAKTERLDRYIVEACKQCRRNRLMQIRADRPLNTLASFAPPSTMWLLHPDTSRATAKSIHEASQMIKPDIASLLFVIGPEGGFSDSEIDTSLQSGANLLSLGDRILRVETAVAVAATIGSQWLSSANPNVS